MHQENPAASAYIDPSTTPVWALGLRPYDPNDNRPRLVLLGGQNLINDTSHVNAFGQWVSVAEKVRAVMEALGYHSDTKRLLLELSSGDVGTVTDENDVDAFGESLSQNIIQKTKRILSCYVVLDATPEEQAGAVRLSIEDDPTLEAASAVRCPDIFQVVSRVNREEMEAMIKGRGGIDWLWTHPDTANHIFKYPLVSALSADGMTVLDEYARGKGLLAEDAQVRHHARHRPGM